MGSTIAKQNWKKNYEKSENAREKNVQGYGPEQAIAKFERGPA